MSVRLFIAEKPVVAKDIANALGGQMERKENNWILHLTHEYHDKSSDAYLLMPSIYNYTYVYRVIACLQHKHSEGDYKTEDLSGKQTALLLNSLLNLSVLSDEQVMLFIEEEYHTKRLDLFWNWEQGVVKFCFDEDSRKKGEIPYFYPDVVFSDYEINGTVSAFLAMDNEV
ncbi:hypothetical protein [Xenorhabdus bovienii]|uniref:hypothetical protein n=1 Tax=Xenorhabdus bovienii TaxID=40576 RepID=UPI0023B23AEA|nr:hypothetical protein [Xenorhabdus bovienii]MDE9544148.1 hypothetical protein [Xenorhabdus bovienii]